MAVTAADHWVSWREAQGLSQLEASRKFDIPQGSLSQIERGQKTPTLAQIVLMQSLTAGTADEVTPSMWNKDADARAARKALAESGRKASKSKKRKAA